MNKNPLISIVSPVYMAESIIDELIQQLKLSLETITTNYEIILVEDSSLDLSWPEIEKNCKLDSRIKGIKLSRNFGQHYAISAGLYQAKGEWVVVMDCDLQDRPDEIPQLYAKALEGFDSVFAQREFRNDSFTKRILSKIFYKVFSFFTDTNQDASVANFGIYKRCVIDSVLSMGDKNLYFPAMVQWVGFRKAYLPIRHSSRFVGKTSYSFRRLFNLAIDNIITFSNKPLLLSTTIGLTIAIISLLIGVYYIIAYFQGTIQIAGYTSLIISIWFLSGLIISLLGILGIYIGKTFDAAKNRPVFIIERKVNL